MSKVIAKFKTKQEYEEWLKSGRQVPHRIIIVIPSDTPIYIVGV